ncbi:Uncharacterised protein [Mycobacteroides abscessus subsp. abscessus]|nr:Uncharacterised protein [Mycobacteroides abscessus subsp. abscessus]
MWRMVGLIATPSANDLNTGVTCNSVSGNTTAGMQPMRQPAQ